MKNKSRPVKADNLSFTSNPIHVVHKPAVSCHLCPDQSSLIQHGHNIFDSNFPCHSVIASMVLFQCSTAVQSGVRVHRAVPGVVCEVRGFIILDSSPFLTVWIIALDPNVLCKLLNTCINKQF